MKEQIFISSFWHSNHSKKALIERFKKYALALEKNKKSTIKSNQGGFHSKNLDCSISLFSEFKEMIQPKIIEYCDLLTIISHIIMQKVFYQQFIIFKFQKILGIFIFILINLKIYMD